MKKIVYVFTLMFAMVLMNTSCTKPNENNQNSTEIQAGDLIGSWYSHSLLFNSVIYSTNDEYVGLELQYNYVTIDFKDVKADKTLTLHSDYSYNGDVNTSTDFDVTNGIITINGSLKFEIQPETDIALGKLVIKFVSPQTATGSKSKNPIGGIYTLTHVSTN